MRKRSEPVSLTGLCSWPSVLQLKTLHKLPAYWKISSHPHQSGSLFYTLFPSFLPVLPSLLSHPSVHSFMTYSWCHFSSVAQSCPTLCNPMDCNIPRFTIHHQLLELAQTHVHLVSDAIQPSHPLSSPSPPVFNLSQHQGLFQWVGASHQVATVLELQLQWQSVQWIFRTDFL